MPSQSLGYFGYAIQDVHSLLGVHEAISNKRKGRKDLGFLTRSGVVMLCAAWELYVEDVLEEGCVFLADQLKDPKKLPKEAKSEICRFVGREKHDHAALTLAGDGWKRVYLAAVQARTRALNTPSSKILAPMFADLLGATKIKDAWKKDIAKLDEFVTLRGEIAHQGAHAKYVHANVLRRNFGMIIRLTYATDGYVCGMLKEITGKAPWRKPRIPKNLLTGGGDEPAVKPDFPLVEPQIDGGLNKG